MFLSKETLDDTGVHSEAYPWKFL